jgi:hypothetical protein
MEDTAARIRFAREIPLRHGVDVFVAGGGPAGVAAAVAAARTGARVLLAEAHSCLGGAGTAGLVPAFMQFGDGINLCAGGIGREVLTRLRAAGGAATDYDLKEDNRRSVAIKAEVLKRVYDDMLVESGAGFAFHTALIDVQAEAGQVTAAICAAKSGLFAVRARVCVDCTGDGDLAAWAGAPFEKGDDKGDLQPGTLCSLWADVDWPAVKASGLGAGRSRIHGAIADGVFTIPDPGLVGMWEVGEDLGGGNIGHTFGVDGTDERSVTQALIWGRKLVPEYERYYKQYLKGFERMQLAATGSLLGVRETRRIMGDYLLNVEDFKSRAVFEDEIGRYCYPVDIHASRPDPNDFERSLKDFLERYRYDKGESYGIPYRCLLPRGLGNVLVAGRCLSADRCMQGSLRVMPGCYITGQAAGVAAAMAAADAPAGSPADVREVDVKQLQARLVATGAYLPHAQRGRQ